MLRNNYKVNIMQNHQETLSYCFNSTCTTSIINTHRSGSIGIELEMALANNFNCPQCGEELVSPVLNRMRESIIELIKVEQSNVVLLDDDLMFHYFVKQSLNQELMNVKYFTNGFEVLNQLTRNIDHEDILPDIIFLDLDMPILNGWVFLDMFKAITKCLTKKIDIYIVSSCEEKAVDLLKYPFVNCFISKNATLQFLKMLNQELAERQIMKPSISLHQPAK